MSEESKAVEAVKLEGECPGHWSSPEGRDIATEYAGKSRADLAMSDVTDFALANVVYMVNRSDLALIAYQTAAKERIRWLSVQLALARTLPPSSIRELYT